LKAAASINFPIHIEIKLCQFRSSGSLISVTILFEERRVIDIVPEKARVGTYVTVVSDSQKPVLNIKRALL